VKLQENRKIPFNRSSLLGRELEYIFQAMSIGQIAGDQTFSKKCQALLEQTLGIPKALVTTSCTLHLSKFGLRYGRRAGDLPVTEDISDRLLRLPLFCTLTDEEQTRVIEAVRELKP
jgi:dTDP-4-amino-4,6-dideoxygalactose transaminase